MRFALRATTPDSHFLAAYYASSNLPLWSPRLDDAGSYPSLSAALRIAKAVNTDVEIIVVNG